MHKIGLLFLTTRYNQIKIQTLNCTQLFANAFVYLEKINKLCHLNLSGMKYFNSKVDIFTENINSKIGCFANEIPKVGKQ